MGVWERLSGLIEAGPILRKKGGQLVPLSPSGRPATGGSTPTSSPSRAPAADDPGLHPKIDRLRGELDKITGWAADQLSQADFLGREELQRKLRGVSKLPSDQVMPALKAVADAIHAKGKWFDREDRAAVKNALDGLMGAYKAASQISGSTRSDTGLYQKNMRYVPGDEKDSNDPGRWIRQADTKTESAWSQALDLLREGPEEDLDSNFRSFQAKMEEAQRLKDRVYISLERLVVQNSKFADLNKAWKFLHDFQEAGLEIESAMNAYEKIINDFKQFSRESERESGQGSGGAGERGPVFHK